MFRDYSKYTLDELYDIEAHIDRDSYPDRYELVVEQIRIKEPKPSVSGSVKSDDVNSKEEHPVPVAGSIASSLFVCLVLAYGLARGEFGSGDRVISIYDNPDLYWGMIVFFVLLLMYELFGLYKAVVARIGT